MKEHVIGFRVSWNEFGKIEKQAEQRDEEVNEWCRNLVLSESHKPFGLTASERILLEEIVVLRKIVGVVAARILSSEEMAELRESVSQHYEEWGRQVLEKRAGTGSERTNEETIEKEFERA